MTPELNAIIMDLENKKYTNVDFNRKATELIKIIEKAFQNGGLEYPYPYLVQLREDNLNYLISLCQFEDKVKDRMMISLLGAVKWATARTRGITGTLQNDLIPNVKEDLLLLKSGLEQVRMELLQANEKREEEVEAIATLLTLLEPIIHNTYVYSIEELMNAMGTSHLEASIKKQLLYAIFKHNINIYQNTENMIPHSF